MPVFSPAERQITQPTSLTTINETAIYTCPSDYYAVIEEIYAADVAGAARTITLEAAIGGVDYTIGFQVAIAANTPLRIQLSGLVLQAGETIDATASNGSVHTIVSGCEFRKSPGQ